MVMYLESWEGEQVWGVTWSRILVMSLRNQTSPSPSLCLCTVFHPWWCQLHSKTGLPPDPKKAFRGHHDLMLPHSHLVGDYLHLRTCNRRDWIQFRWNKRWETISVRGWAGGKMLLDVSREAGPCDEAICACWLALLTVRLLPSHRDWGQDLCLSWWLHFKEMAPGFIRKTFLGCGRFTKDRERIYNGKSFKVKKREKKRKDGFLRKGGQGLRMMKPV